MAALPATPTLAVEGWNIKAAELDSDEVPGTYMLGDVDNDKDVDANDALMALQASTNKIYLDTNAEKAADVNQDGTVAANDALLILQKATKKIEKFPQK